MKVTQVVTTENEKREVTLELSDPQIRFITEVGIGVLLAAGAAAFVPKEDNPTEGILQINVDDPEVVH